MSKIILKTASFLKYEINVEVWTFKKHVHQWQNMIKKCQAVSVRRWPHNLFHQPEDILPNLKHLHQAALMIMYNVNESWPIMIHDG